MESIRALIRFGTDFLDRHGVPNARRNAEWMLCHTMGCRNTDLYFAGDGAPTREQVARYEGLLTRRGAREPLQYILETTEFMSLPFHSRPGVFIPRPDTEILVEVVESLTVGRRDTLEVCDLCCGSGVIAVSLAKRDNARVTAVDLSAEATALTTLNAELNEVEEQVRVVRMESGNFLPLHADVAAAALRGEVASVVAASDAPATSPRNRRRDRRGDREVSGLSASGLVVISCCLLLFRLLWRF